MFAFLVNVCRSAQSASVSLTKVTGAEVKTRFGDSELNSKTQDSSQ